MNRGREKVISNSASNNTIFHFPGNQRECRELERKEANQEFNVDKPKYWTICKRRIKGRKNKPNTELVNDHTIQSGQLGTGVILSTQIIVIQLT